MGKWDKIAQVSGAETAKEPLAKDGFAQQKAGVSQGDGMAGSSVSPVIVIDRAVSGVNTATALADKVKAKFKEEGDFAGGAVSDCVSQALGPSVAQEFGLVQAQEVTYGIGGPGMGGGSSSGEEEEEQ